MAVVGSAAARDAAAAVFPGAYHVIPPGIDLAAFRLTGGRRPGPVRLLFAGADSRRQGLGVLLRALRRLDDIGERFELHVCGHEAQESRFGLMVPPGLAARVVFHGRLARAEMPALLRYADVLCAPSLDEEAAGTVLLEAMAAGTAVVASDTPVSPRS